MKYAFFGKVPSEKLIADWIYDDINPDIVFSFGGDGTMLGAIHKYIGIIDKVKFIGVKKGNLGFFYSFEDENLDYLVNVINNNTLKVYKYNLLNYELIGNKKIEGLVLNELAITNPIHTQIIDVLINDIEFERFRGTGFIISPPAGSTAYNKSLGGCIIDPSLEAFQLMEIASINNRLYKTISSPIVFSKKYCLTLKLINQENVYISGDGQEIKCDGLKEIKVSLSNKKVNIINIEEDFFIKVKKAFLK